MKLKTTIATALGILALSCCAGWTDTEPIPVTDVRPWEKSPEVWKEYQSMIWNYKSREHNLTYVRFGRGGQDPVNEGGFLRCLPDSLDFVSLTDAADFSEADAEDMEWMRAVGTKVLYQIDLAKTQDAADAIVSVKTCGLDGFSLTGADLANSKTASDILAELAMAKGADKYLVFEGDPAIVPENLFGYIDYFVLATDKTDNSYDLANTFRDATDLGIPARKILFAASFDGEWYDISLEEADPLVSVADKVIELGPIAGMALYDIAGDYYHYDGEWLKVRSIISRLNR